MTIQTTTTIPFQLHGSKIHLPIKINNLETSSFVLDTCAPIWIIELDHAKTIGLPLENPVEMVAMGASGETSITAYQLSGLNISMRDIHLQDQSIMAMPMPDVKMGYPNLQGIVGGSFIGQFVMSLDFVSQTMTLTDPSAFQYQGVGEILPIQIGNGVPHVDASLTPRGRDPIKGKFAIDLGGNTAISLNTPTVQEHGLIESSERLVHSVLGFGVGGAIHGYIGRAQSFQLGSNIFEKPVATFAIAEKGAHARPGFTGSIGIEILRRFNIILDYSRERIILEKNAHYDMPFEHDMSGLVLVSENGLIRINDVIEDSPAADVGLIPGDFITQMDGAEVSSGDLGKLRTEFKRFGNTYILGVKREKDRFNVIIHLKRMV